MTRASPHPAPATVHVVDDDVGLRQALVNLLWSMGHRAEPYDSPASFLARAKTAEPGCLLLDIEFPTANGLEFQVLLAQQAIAMPVILMTGRPDVPGSIRGLKAGAIDFLVKPFEDQALLTAVTLALERDATQRSTATRRHAERARYDALSTREKQVMAMVTSGAMNKQVAAALGLREITIKTHRGALMRKMNASNLPELVRMADSLGIAANRAGT